MARTKKKSTAKALPAKKKFGVKVYTKSSCGKTKAQANATAANIRKKGGLARVVKDKKTGKHCVYKRSRK